MKDPSRTNLWLNRACAVWLLGLGLYFVFVRPALLPEDPRFMGSTPQQIAAALPGLGAWLKHVFAVMGGFMVAAGALTFVMGNSLETSRSAVLAFAIAGIFGVGLMSVVNFSLGSDFRWMLVAPVILWTAAVVSALRTRGRRREAP